MIINANDRGGKIVYNSIWKAKRDQLSNISQDILFTSKNATNKSLTNPKHFTGR